MASTVKESNNIVYVEPNYNGSVDGHEVAPQLEDYSIFINLEVEVKGRNIRSRASSDDNKIIMSWVSNGSSTNNNIVNLMQGSKIPLHDGTSTYSLTTNYTDVFIKDLKKVGGNSEMFGISSVDIAYNNYMVPEVTIQFVDVRGAALFSPKESSVTNNGHDVSVSNTDDVDIANTFFQCFFTFPYPKFTLMVKGFYGEPVSYELTCADFRATFDSSTGNFNCTAKFVGYAFSFLNDVMVNYMIAAPYSDYIGSDYWKSREFTIKGISGEDVAMPTIIELIRKYEAVKASGASEVQSDAFINEKNAAESKRNELSALKEAYNIYARQLSAYMSAMKPSDEKKSGITTLFDESVNFDGNIKKVVLLSPSNRKNETLSDYVNDYQGNINGAYSSFKQKLDNYNRNYPNDTLPEPKNMAFAKPYVGITNSGNTGAQFNRGVNNELFTKDHSLFKTVSDAVASANGVNRVNKYIESGMTLVYYYTDNGFNDIIEERQRDIAAKEISLTDELKSFEEDELTKKLGFKPTVENITRILMAHFETFCHMIYKVGEIIGSNDPKRTMQSLGISDADDLPDVPDEYKSVAIPPFPKVTKLVYRQGNKNREETWVGEYNADFREKDLVHGILNGVAETKRVMNTLSENINGSSESYIEPLDILYPMTPYDLTSGKKLYGSVNSDNLSEVLSLAVLRALGIFYASGVFEAKNYANAIGRVEALNMMNDVKLSESIRGKISALNTQDIINMLNGIDNNTTIPKDGMWPWQSNATDTVREKFITNNRIIDPFTSSSQSSTGASTTNISAGGTLLYSNIFFEGYHNIGECVLPIKELSWDKVRSELYIDGAKARLSDDFMLTKEDNFVEKDCYFTVDTNHLRLSKIINSQLNGLEGIDGYKNALMSQCEYKENDYSSLTKDGNKYIVYGIENPNDLMPTSGSCMLPQNGWNGTDFKLFDRGYNMDDFARYTPNSLWVYNNGETVKRKGENGFSKYMEELVNTDLTITEFKFISLLDGFDDPVSDASLFGNRYYYLQKDIRVKAFLFIRSLSTIYKYNEMVDTILNSNRSMAMIPLMGVLYVGGLLWIHNNSNTVIDVDANGKIINGFGYTLTGSKNFERLNKNLRSDVKRSLIRYFEKWVNGGIESDESLPSFKYISENLELSFKRRDSEEFFKHLGETEEKTAMIGLSRTWFKEDPFNGYKSLVDFFSGELGDSFFKSYITVDEDADRSWNSGNLDISKNFKNLYAYYTPLRGTGSLRLGNRDNSPAMMRTVRLILAPCIFVKNTAFFTKNIDNAVRIDKGILENYLNGFIDEISSTIDGTGNANNSISQADKTNTAEEIKIGIYRYCKLLYDKWVGGLSEKEFHNTWTMDRFFDGIDERHDKYFHFIDAYYNKIGDEVLINMGEFMKQIYGSWQSSQLSLLSFLSSLYSKNKMTFLCVQNFADLSDTVSMSNMFDTLAYTDHWNVKRNPNFLVVYPYEPSSHLELEGQEYENDGFMLNDFNNVASWPEALKSKSTASSSSLKIPAFGVSYGKMYQSYFQNIDVSMDSPTVTEQSIRAQFEIASSMNEGEAPDNRSNMATLGQDLFTIYSNNSYTCNVTMLGCAWIQPLMYFVLTNVPMFRGTYLIEKVTHHLEPGNMVTKFTGVRMAKTSNTIVRTSSIRDGSNISQEGSFSSNAERRRAELASVSNDCAYKIYPLSEDNVSDIDTLAATPDSEKNAMNAMAALVAMGYNKYAAAAIAGNIMKESGFKQSLIDNMVKANNDSECDGMKGGTCQWQGSRLVGLLDGKPTNNANGRCIVNKCPLPCFGKQLRFLQLEIDTLSDFEDSKRVLATATKGNLSDVTEAFRANFERSRKSEKDTRERQEFAAQILDKYEQEHPTLSYKAPANDVAITDDKISNDARLFLIALNKTIKASGSEMVIDYDRGMSVDNTLYLVNSNMKTGISKVFDMIVNGYTDYVSSVKWVAPSSSYSSEPKMIEAVVSNSPDKIKISMSSEDNINGVPDIDVNLPGNEGGVNDSFLQSIVKRYKTPDNKQLKTEVPMLAGKDLNEMFDRLNVADCKTVEYAYGDSSVSTASAEAPKERSPYTGSFNQYRFVEYLRKWQTCICEFKGEARKKYGGCNSCTGVVNRALQNSGLGDRYSTKYPWQMYDRMKPSNEWVEVDSGYTNHSDDFPFSATPKACDICLMWRRGNKNSNFHACGYDGNVWISDFKQTSCNVYKSRDGVFDIEWHLMRHISQNNNV